MIISGSADSIYRTFERKLSEVNKKEILFKLTKGLLYTFIICLTAGLFLLIAESVFHFSTGLRKFIYWGFLSASVTTLVYFISNYLLKLTGIIKPPDLISYSKKVGNHFDDIKDKLSNSLSLYKTYSNSNTGTVFSPDLISADISETERKTRNVNFKSIISFSKLKMLCYFLAAALLISIISFSVFPSEMLGSLKRIVNYNYIYLEDGQGISFDVNPGNTEIAAGSDLEIKISVNSTKGQFNAEEIEFYTKPLQDDNDKYLSDAVKLKPESDGSFKTILEGLSNSLVYFVKYKNIKSDE